VIKGKVTTDVFQCRVSTDLLCFNYCTFLSAEATNRIVVPIMERNDSVT